MFIELTRKETRTRPPTIELFNAARIVSLVPANDGSTVFTVDCTNGLEVVTVEESYTDVRAKLQAHGGLTCETAEFDRQNMGATYADLLARVHELEHEVTELRGQ